MAMQVTEIRFVVDEGVDPHTLMQDILGGLEYVFGAVELKYDGFGHHVPDTRDKYEVALNTNDEGYTETVLGLAQGQ